MVQVRAAGSRGTTRLPWLDSRHTFSFNRYTDPEFVGYGPLRVINDDRVAAGGGFGTHGHADMEILSFVLDGALEHADSIGARGVLEAGAVQRMSAGTGIRHSELNASKTAPLRFLQVWIEPERKGLPPSYEERRFGPDERRGRLLLVASHDGRDGALTVHQDVDVWMAALDGEERVRLEVRPGRQVWVQVTGGALAVNGVSVSEGDGVAVSDEEAVVLSEGQRADVVVFDLTGGA